MAWGQVPAGGGGGGGGGSPNASDVNVDASGHSTLIGTDAQDEFDQADDGLTDLLARTAADWDADQTDHAVFTGATIQDQLDSGDIAVHSLQTSVAALVGADVLTFKGAIDASANPNYPAANAGDVYRISVAGKIGGASGINVEVGDMIVCTTDSSASGNQATVGSHWFIEQANLDGAVIGPASATDARVAVFDGTTGKLIKDGGTLLSALALSSAVTAETTARQTADTVLPFSPNTGQTGDYTAQATDIGTRVQMNKATAQAFTINNSIFSAGQVIEVEQLGAGQVTITAGSGVTLHNPGGLKTRVQYSSVRIIFDSASVAKVDGDATT